MVSIHCAPDQVRRTSNTCTRHKTNSNHGRCYLVIAGQAQAQQMQCDVRVLFLSWNLRGSDTLKRQIDPSDVQSAQRLRTASIFGPSILR